MAQPHRHAWHDHPDYRAGLAAGMRRDLRNPHPVTHWPEPNRHWPYAAGLEDSQQAGAQPDLFD